MGRIKITELQLADLIAINTIDKPIGKVMTLKEKGKLKKEKKIGELNITNNRANIGKNIKVKHNNHQSHMMEDDDNEDKYKDGFFDEIETYLSNEKSLNEQPIEIDFKGTTLDRNNTKFTDGRPPKSRSNYTQGVTEETECKCQGGVGCCAVESHCPEGEMCKGGCCVPNSGIRRQDSDRARRRPYSAKARDMRGSRDMGNR